jgi:flavin-dependent dehydrogenase/SAM-dependent methyltransferase
MFDAIIVGARCTGSPTAMQLAAKGYKTLLVDKAHFPSDILSTHWIVHSGADYLHRWGLLDKVRASNCPPLSKIKLSLPGIVLEGTPPPTANGVTAGYCIRRKYLDTILVEAAVKAGAELREGFTVTGLVWDGDRVVGVKGHGENSVEVEERAKIVIGADGTHSKVAGWVKAPFTEKYDGPTTCCYYNYYSDFEHDPNTVEIIGKVEGWGGGILPTNDGQVCITMSWLTSLFPDYRSDPAATMKKAIESDPDWAPRLARSSGALERVMGVVEVPAWYKKPFGPGWALAGDAAHYRHPLSAQGISDGFRDSELLANAIDEAFSGRRPAGEAFGAYETARYQATKAVHDSTQVRAAMGPPAPEEIQLLNMLRGNQPAIDRFFGLDAGTVRAEDFFAPQNMQEISTRAIESRVTRPARDKWDDYWRNLSGTVDKVLWDCPPEEYTGRLIAEYPNDLDRNLPIIDLACGNGRKAHYLAKHFKRAIGCDVSAEAIRGAKELYQSGNLEFEVLDATSAADARKLHARIGDANVHVSAMFHSLHGDANRAAAAETVSILCGKTGRAIIEELGPRAAEVFAEIRSRPGPPSHKVIEFLQHGIVPAELGEETMPNLLGPHGFKVLRRGYLRQPTNDLNPDGTPMTMPLDHWLFVRG